MQDGARCAISEREARRSWLVFVRVTVGTAGSLLVVRGVVCRSGRGSHGPPTHGMEGWLGGRLQGAGDGDQLMEGKEELWSPGKRGAQQ